MLPVIKEKYAYNNCNNTIDFVASGIFGRTGAWRFYPRPTGNSYNYVPDKDHKRRKSR